MLRGAQIRGVKDTIAGHEGFEILGSGESDGQIENAMPVMERLPMIEIPYRKKYMLTLREAAEHFHIGENRNSVKF